jgi:hypothetical protein
MQNGCEAEALVHVYWDKERCECKIVPPMQSVGKAHISVIVPTDETMDAERYIHVADIHSHNSMPAFFSKTDNDDERATRVYMVIGYLDRAEPTIAARISVGGRFVPIDARQVIDIPVRITTPSTLGGIFSPEYICQMFALSDCSDFPPEWTAAVNVTEHPRHEASQIDIPLLEQSFRRPLRWWRLGERA